MAVLIHPKVEIETGRDTHEPNRFCVEIPCSKNVIGLRHFTWVIHADSRNRRRLSHSFTHSLFWSITYTVPSSSFYDECLKTREFGADVLRDRQVATVCWNYDAGPTQLNAGVGGLRGVKGVWYAQLGERSNEKRSFVWNSLPVVQWTSSRLQFIGGGPSATK